ncbi:protein adenylyltransferase SelO [Anaerobranca gottschalkii]|uniref:Protein nucleotidyltransferase YdiU n=1 Tax=Anaerobranca gottschalkii DSM 13577 TaxID=1120990 RepID=A0A1I0AJ11_9FIRM|nr:YdiU family protein [Anaerobranca gottschalkii]SES94192.1 Uncharacterized conserved protein YdiU, UPF0061 family [Anaerobranca gottschalkii DSM 13577]
MAEKNIGWNFQNSYPSLPKIFYSVIKPTPVSNPKLAILNHNLGKDLGLDTEKLAQKEGIEILAGNSIPQGAFPIAQSYAGHQFGYFTMLGDGRAHLLGEHITPSGGRVDIQLKGSGKTPYSRGGDGRAALGPMLREYIISEGMYFLGIPTTRSLAVVITGEKVFREKELPGAILTRVASSHIRVGTFQYGARWGTLEELKALTDYTINRHFPEAFSSESPYRYFLDEVIRRQARLIASWQLIGFVHGVMNTDNMAISGETIDYGPCAFLDTYNPKTVFSSIDRHGRYAFMNQGKIGAWNLARFAETLLPLLDSDEGKALEIAQCSLDKYFQLFDSYWLNGMRKKLGLFNEEKEDKQLIHTLLDILEKYQGDYTNTFRALTLGDLQDELLQKQEFKYWYNKWQNRLRRQPQGKEEVERLMKSVNPSIIPRNHRVEEALEGAVERNDYSVMKNLLKALEKPYNYDENNDYYISPPPKGCPPYRTFCGT